MGGLAMAGPFFRAAFSPPIWKLALAHSVGAALPSFGTPTGLKGKQMSKDIVVQTQYDTDPNMTRVMTARYYQAYNGAQKRLFGTASTVDFPVFLQHGGADPIASAKRPRAGPSRPPPLVRMDHLPGHEARGPHEFDRGRVVSDLMYWLDRHVLAHVQRGA